MRFAATATNRMAMARAMCIIRMHTVQGGSQGQGLARGLACTRARAISLEADGCAGGPGACGPS